MKNLVLAATLSLAAGTAQAATIPFGPTSAGGSGPVVNFNGLATPTAISGDATFTFSVRGDLDHVTEYVDVLIDGISLGRVFDNNSANDEFNFASDSGSQNSSVHTGSATIANAVFAGLIADGFLNLSFAFSPEVNFGGTVNELYGSISFTEVAAVPLPATAGLLGLGLFGMGALRRNRSRKTA